MKIDVNLANLSNCSIHTFSELEFSEHLGNEANGQALRSLLWQVSTSGLGAM